ncbi:MAG: aminoacyl-histidine dipeptidase [Anaerolineales bacterium]|jgi:dipeptidase D|nr:aminoacyl-histidine dipeptidase [Anaerolineales bacterium]
MNAITQEILNTFSQIAAIPRCSGNEAAISLWLQQWAGDHGFEYLSDSVGNAVIRIPAAAGYEQAPIVVIQGHTDMVGQKTPESKHDFKTDPIRLIYDGDWLKADQTTLGADNGIGVAMGLVLAKDPNLAHPPLELLFTVDEEVGMSGARALEPKFVRGRILLNIDSEEEGMFTIGCAGGRTTTITLPLMFASLPEHVKPFTLSATGMRGGHSGDDIRKYRANANKIVARALNWIRASYEIRLIAFKGGSIANAIPREADATFAVDPKYIPAIQAQIADYECIVQQEYPDDPNVTIRLTEAASDFTGYATAAFDYFAKERLRTGLSQQNTDTIINLLCALPHGVARMSPAIQGLVETSNNLAIVEIRNSLLNVLSSQRSSARSRLDELTARIEALALLAGASVNSNPAYPGWNPNMASPLLARCQETYRKLFGIEPGVESCHAGLECGIIGSKFDGMDMISFGPTIKDCHSPDERVYIPSISRVWDFLVNLLASYQ